MRPLKNRLMKQNTQIRNIFLKNQPRIAFLHLVLVEEVSQSVIYSTGKIP